MESKRSAHHGEHQPDHGSTTSTGAKNAGWQLTREDLLLALLLGALLRLALHHGRRLRLLRNVKAAIPTAMSQWRRAHECTAVHGGATRRATRAGKLKPTGGQEAQIGRRTHLFLLALEVDEQLARLLGALLELGLQVRQLRLQLGHQFLRALQARQARLVAHDLARRQVAEKRNTEGVISKVREQARKWINRAPRQEGNAAATRQEKRGRKRRSAARAQGSKPKYEAARSKRKEAQAPLFDEHEAVEADELQVGRRRRVVVSAEWMGQSR